MAPRATVPHKDIRRFDRSDANERDFLKGRYFPAACPATVDLRQFVRVTGPAILGVRQVDSVNITDKTKMPAIGIVVEKPTPTSCVVQIHGEINGGLFSGLDPTLPGPYFIGTDSKIVYPPPEPTPGTYAMWQVVGRALGATIFLVEPNLFLVKRLG